MDRTDQARTLAWASASLSLLLTLAGLAVGVRAQAQSVGEPLITTHLLFSPLGTIAYGLIGVLVAPRHPRNPIGWIFSLVALLFGLTFLASSYGEASRSGGVGLPGVEVGRWLDLWVWIPATMVPLTFLLLLFPDGHLPSARWRPIAWSAGLGLAAYAISTALHPLPPIEPNPPTNPFGLPGAAGALEQLGNVVRHARARTCLVRLRVDDALDLEIRDDGTGLPPDSRAGVGLASMRERTAELGGTWAIETAAGRGIRILVRLPLLQEGT